MSGYEKKIGRFHVITDTSMQDRFSHEELAERAIAGGADTIQFRQKTGTTRDLIEIASRMVAVCRRAGIPLIVNDRVDVAVAAEADGVHVGQEDLPVALARRMIGEGRTVGATAKTPEAIRLAAEDGADYFGYGPVFATGSKGDAGEVKGLDGVREIIRAMDADLPIPLIAIGGIQAATAADVIGAGAHGVAVISAVCGKEDPAAAAGEFAERVRMAAA
jgi:thiamine-phosphate pyrophosphorylase